VKEHLVANDLINGNGNDGTSFYKNEKLNEK